MLNNILMENMLGLLRNLVKHKGVIVGMVLIYGLSADWKGRDNNLKVLD